MTKCNIFKEFFYKNQDFLIVFKNLECGKKFNCDFT